MGLTMLKESLERMLLQTDPKRQRHGLRAYMSVEDGDSELVKMFKEQNGDKWFCHSYIPIYEYLFEEIRYEKLNIVEIGIWRGDSLRVWEQYFPNANVLGIDINPDCANLKFKRSEIDIQDQMGYNYFFSKYNGKEFDIVIEDGKHEYIAQIISAAIFNNFMKKDSIYIMEDIKGDLSQYDVLRGVRINLQKFKKRFDDKLILLPHGEKFKEKSEHVRKVVEEFSNGGV